MALLNFVSFGSGNGLASVWGQAITWTTAELLIAPPETNFVEIE